MSVDAIGNFLTSIRNGVMAGKREIKAPHSRLKHEIAKVLLDEGFIRHVSIVDIDATKKELTIGLKYVNGESVIHEITRESTPGLRIYYGYGALKPVIGNLGVSILTTNRGVMTNKKARSLSVGGELLCTVW
jgi:small subunit ribosomal protein S8